MTTPTSVDIRARLVETLRRDLIGPGPGDTDLARERLKEKPSGWYVTGYLAPVPEPSGPSTEIPEEGELFEEGDPLVGDDHGADTTPALRARLMTLRKTCHLPFAFAHRHRSASRSSSMLRCTRWRSTFPGATMSRCLP